MRLPPLDYLAPTTVDEAAGILAEQGPSAAVLAGGTDLIVRLKQRLRPVRSLVSLKAIPGLKDIRLDGLNLILGAAAPLKAVMDHPLVKEHAPGLIEALKTIGAPAVQHDRGTIGGNLLLDPRCNMYNQSQWWRSGKERCFKNGGQVCNVLPDSRACSAACQSDGAVMLVALSAQAVLVSVRGERLVAAGDLFSGQGETPFTAAADELLTEIRIPAASPGTGASYQKLRWRSAVDYPLASAAAVVMIHKGRIDRARLVVGAAGPRPLVVEEAGRILRGRAVGEANIDQAAAAAEQAAAGYVVDNAVAPAEYRRRMIPVLARRALAEAVTQAEASA